MDYFSADWTFPWGKLIVDTKIMLSIISANVENQFRAIKDLAPWIPEVRKNGKSWKSLKCSKKPDGVIFLGGTGDV